MSNIVWLAFLLYDYSYGSPKVDTVHSIFIQWVQAYFSCPSYLVSFLLNSAAKAQRVQVFKVRHAQISFY